MRITVRQYYGEFASLWGLAAGSTLVPPLLHLVAPESSAIAAYLYPPLGDVEGIAIAATIGFWLASTFVVFTCCESSRKIHPTVPGTLVVGLAISMCVLIMLFVLYVRHIKVPTEKLDVPVSVGYHRSNFAVKNYSDSTDWEMLNSQGPQEDQIQELWTSHSILVVRVLLWLFYTLTVACFLSIVSLAVYRHATEEAEKKSGSNVPEQART
jgi:hypothetical protein